MIDRAAVVGAVAAELDERAGECLAEHDAIGARVADRLGLIERDLKPDNVSTGRGRVYLFVRRQSWAPLDVVSRFGGALVATRNERGRMNRSLGWYAAAAERGVELVTWEWMLPPGAWRAGLAGEVAFAKGIGARAVLLNVEPASGAARGTAADWRRKPDEVKAYVETARDLCDARALELWVTSWALPSAAPDFPWLELLRPAHRAIAQPYEVHGREGAAYTALSIASYRAHGARDVICGRGAHELDKGDDDAWRTPAEIRTHRASTPAGLDEAWWPPAGTMPRNVVDAIVE